jgi:ectoine hydroxylase-related dioxygenase (phytanoyl-CoA dioxygenase family)
MSLANEPLRSLTAVEIAEYEKNGAAVVRQMLPLEWIELMRDAVEDVLANPGRFGVNYNASEKKGRFFGDLFSWLDNDDFRRFAQESPLPIIAAQATRSERMNFFYDQLLVKEPDTVERTPWHQDLPYWPLQGEQIISLWVPLDAVTPESGSVIYIQGSHRWDSWFQPQSFNANPKVMEPEHPFGDDFDPLPDIDADPDTYVQLCWELEPGDLILHHPRTVHGAGGNRSFSQRRRAIAMRYTGDDVRYDPRPGNFVSMVVDLGLLEDPGISAGSRLDCELFPRVLPR